MPTSTDTNNVHVTAMPGGSSRQDGQHLVKPSIRNREFIPLSSPQPAGMRYSMLEMDVARGGRLLRFITASLARELGILLSLSVLFPFWIHIIPVPENVGLGPRLLPMFYAPLLAALLGRTHSALIIALAAPWLNYVLTMHPTPRGAIIASIQLLAFVVTLRILLPRVSPRWFLAVPAFLCGIVAAAPVVAVFSGHLGVRSMIAWAAHSIVIGLPGLAILVFINWLAVRNYPPGFGDKGPLSA